ncbi:creatininase family protein [Streptosporangium carneum]|uniref:creatininase family protein n=1 Tax=Streptosporangium carneum TaxID=47481 RepID=UPI0028529113|nr:creatininase family protein [Streptosporangium carneum]
MLSNVVQEAGAEGRTMALFPTREDWQQARAAAELANSMHEDMHAGEIETSILLHACPEVIRPGYQDADHIADDRRHLLTEGMRAYTDSGVIGRPSLATAEKDKAVLDALTSGFADVVALLAKS